MCADSYDAMTSDRPYIKGLPHPVAVDELVKSKKLLQNTLWYTLGKLTIFLFYGILIVII